MEKKMPQAGEPASPTLQRKPKPTHHILVADDDPLICMLHGEILAESGYHVDAAEDGADAWETLQLKNYHLLITDHEMPRMSGIELIKKMRAARMTLPVIMVSGVMPTQELQEQPWLQINAIMHKPHHITELLTTVKEVLDATVSARSQD